ncbi:MAG: hypothetical protein D8H97_32970 [Neisseria sp.]|nr:MAG: hypothetical protein D8H97_32970 [Neisseria sp.]
MTSLPVMMAVTLSLARLEMIFCMVAMLRNIFPKILLKDRVTGLMEAKVQINYTVVARKTYCKEGREATNFMAAQVMTFSWGILTMKSRHMLCAGLKKIIIRLPTYIATIGIKMNLILLNV